MNIIIIIEDKFKKDIYYKGCSFLFLLFMHMDTQHSVRCENGIYLTDQDVIITNNAGSS